MGIQGETRSLGYSSSDFMTRLVPRVMRMPILSRQLGTGFAPTALMFRLLMVSTGFIVSRWGFPQIQESL